MTITKNRNGNELIVLLTGRLDTITAPQLQTELIPEFDQASAVCLDFKELEYVSSAGLRVLLLGEKTAKAKGGTFTLINVSDEIMNVFTMTGFSDFLHIGNIIEH